MKALHLFLLLFSLSGFAQVGIATISPTAMLDVNGDIRVRTIPVLNSLVVAKDSILYSDQSGNLRRVSSKMVVTSHLKSFVKGGFTSASDVPMTIPTTGPTAGTVKIPFDYEEFDENNEYDPSSSTFTAEASGIYAISVQIKSNALVGISTSFGVAIAKNGVIAARQGFANIGISVINVTPPIRNVQTLLKLVPGDKITFITYANLINIGVTSSKDETFFTIAQVR